MFVVLFKELIVPASRDSKRCDHATARSRKKCQRSCKIWVFERKNAQFTTVLPFLGHFLKNLFVLGPFCLRKTFKQKYWSRKKKLSESLTCHRSAQSRVNKKR